MTLHYDRVAIDAVGALLGARDDIGTITLNNAAKRIVGLIIQDVLTAIPTTAEAYLGKIHVSSTDAQLVNFVTDSAIVHAGVSATNAGGKQVHTRFVPLDIQGDDLPKADITFEYEVEAPDGGSTIACAVFLVYTDGDVPADILEALWKRYMPFPVRQSKIANDDELGDALIEVYDDLITFEGKHTEIIGYRGSLVNDALLTAGEHALAYCELSQGGTLLDLNPMKLPLPAWNAELGTQIDNPDRWAEEWPLYISKGNGKEDIQPEFHIQQVTTGALASNVTLTAR